MPAAKLPSNEQKRLLALKRLKVLDTQAEEEFDAIVKAASLTCGVPISLISLVDAERQWFKANIGLEHVKETPRELAFCAHAILSDEILEVEDAAQDARFADNPIVLGDPNIRFYAGAPLKLSTGENVGTLCVIDSKPLQLTEQQRAILTCLATTACHALENHRLRMTERALLTAEEALLDAADYATSIFHNVKDPIIALMLDGTVTHWNAAAEKLFGYSQDDMLGENIARLVPAGLTDSEAKAIMHVADHPEGVGYATQRLSKSGALLDVYVSVAPLYNNAGQLIGATKIVHDMREEVLRKRLLAESEAKYRVLSEASPLGVFATDAAGECTYTNHRFQLIFELTPEDCLGKGWYRAVQPEDFESLCDEWLRATQNLSDFNLEISLLLTSGLNKVIQVHACPSLDAQRNLLGFIGTVQDITERKQQEHAVLEQKNKIEQIVENHNTATFMIDSTHKVTHWNKRCEELTGVKASAVLNQPAWHGFYHQERPTLSDLVLSDHHQQAATYYEKSMPSTITEKGWRVDGWLEELAHGEKRYVSAEAVPILDSEGNVVGVIQTIADMTQYKYAEMALVAQKNQIHQMLDNQSVATFMIDKHHKVTHWNQACTLLTGVDEQTILGQESWLGFYPQARPCLADMVLTHEQNLAEEYYALNGPSTLIETGWHAENWFESLGGKKRYLIFDAAPIYDEQGDMIAVIETLQDTTESKLAEIALGEERQYLASVIEGTQAGTWQWNVATGEAHFNEYWASQLGYTLEELDSLSGLHVETWLKLLHPDDIGQAQLKLQAHFKKESPHYEAEFRMCHKDGYWVWILARGRVLSWLNEYEPEWMYGTHVEIHQLKQQQELLMLANERVAAATINSGIGIWSYHLASEVFDCDQIVNTLFGVAHDEVMTIKSWVNFIHPDDRDDVLMAFCEATSGEREYDIEYRAVWTDHSVHYIRIKAATTRDDNGNVLRLVGAMWDVTPIRELALELAKQYETLRITLKSIGDAVITTDPKGRIT